MTRLMRRNDAFMWIGCAFCAEFVLAAAILALRGAGVHGTDTALAATGRLSFLLFWPAYAGGAMAALFGAVFQPLRRHGREFGLAFASAHIVHLGLVGWLCYIGATPGVRVFEVFGIATGWMYLLALFSFRPMQLTLDAKTWWVLRTLGMNYILYAFATDFLRNPLSGGARRMVEYVPFAVLVVAAPVLRAGAFVVRSGYFGRAEA
jgi:hypothetical protein